MRPAYFHVQHMSTGGVSCIGDNEPPSPWLLDASQALKRDAASPEIASTLDFSHNEPPHGHMQHLGALWGCNPRICRPCVLRRYWRWALPVAVLVIRRSSG